nr:Fe-S cluster assembly protein SufD [Liberibacter crescens]
MLISKYNTCHQMLPGNQDVLAVRNRLFQDFCNQGFPTPKVEFWHYTNLKTLLKSLPEDKEFSFDNLVPDCLVKDSYQLFVKQGKAYDTKITGINIDRFSQFLENGKAVENLASLGQHDAIGYVNGIFVQDGYVIHIPDNSCFLKPIELQSLYAGGQAHVRFSVRFGAKSKATFIERHRAMTTNNSFVSSISEIRVGAGAEVVWVMIQQQGKDDVHLGQLRIILEKEASLKLVVINAGGSLVRQEIFLDINGKDSGMMLRGINLLRNETHNDLSVVLHHNTIDTRSSQIIRNVVLDQANGVFQGMIRVARDAQRTDARMACNSLLVSNKGSFSVKPELEIFANDVQCGHGATISDIDHRHLYYLMARGIPECKARSLLIHAFIIEILSDLEDPQLIEAVENIFSLWLEK